MPALGQVMTTETFSSQRFGVALPKDIQKAHTADSKTVRFPVIGAIRSRIVDKVENISIFQASIPALPEPPPGIVMRLNNLAPHRAL